MVDAESGAGQGFRDRPGSQPGFSYHTRSKEMASQSHDEVVAGLKAKLLQDSTPATTVEPEPPSLPAESGTVAELVASLAGFAIALTAWMVLPLPIYFLVLGALGVWAVAKAK